jgi:centromere/kinetochore protein ZW10
MLSSACFQDEIRIKSREAAPNVDKWIEHARTLQDDIESSKRLANHIVRQAEEEEKRQELIKNQEQYLAFLESEVDFSKQLHEALMLIQEIRETLQRAEDLIHSRQILTGLQTLESKLAAQYP